MSAKINWGRPFVIGIEWCKTVISGLRRRHRQSLCRLGIGAVLLLVRGLPHFSPVPPVGLPVLDALVSIEGIL